MVSLIACGIVTTLVWVLVVLVRGQPLPVLATPASPAEEPLLRLVRETAARLGVHELPQILLGPTAEIWMNVSGDEPVLVVGAPLVWELDEDVLQRYVASELALLPELSRSVIRALHIDERLHRATLADNHQMYVGFLVRRLAAGFHSRTQALSQHCRAASLERAAGVGLAQSEADIHQIGLVDEVWDILLNQWAAPALTRDVAVVELGRGLSEMLVEFRLSGLAPPPGGHEPLLSASQSGQALDQDVSRLVAQNPGAPAPTEIGWSDYGAVVRSEQDRALAAGLFATADRASGQTQPSSVNSLLDLIEQDWGSTLEVALGGTPEQADGEQRLPVLAAHLTAALTTYLVDSHAVSRRLDWVATFELVTPSGSVVPLDQAVTLLLTSRDGGPVRGLLSDLELDPNEPIFMAGTADPTDRAMIVTYGTRGLNWLNVVFCRNELLLLRVKRSPARVFAAWVGRNPVSEEHDRVLHLSVPEMLALYDVVDRIEYVDVVAAKVSTRRAGTTWRARLWTAEKSIKFRGMGSGYAVSTLLAEAVGDRLQTRGPIGNDVGDHRGRGLMATWGLRAGVVLLAVGSFFGYAMTTQSHGAVLTDCVYRSGEDQPWECAATVDTGTSHHDVTLHLVSDFPVGTAIEVQVIPLPVVSDLVIERTDAEAIFVVGLALGLIATVPSAWSLHKRRLRRAGPPERSANVSSPLPTWSDVVSTTTDQQLSFKFDLVGHSGHLDQALVIKVSGRRVLAPTLAFTPLDTAGNPVAGVSVMTAFGSDRGQLAVEPRGDNIDLLYFRGAMAKHVVDVGITVTAVRELGRKKHSTPRVVQLDARGHALRPGSGFDHVKVFNDSPHQMYVRVVVLVLEAEHQPPQGAIQVLPLTPEVIIVPPRGNVRIDPPLNVRQTMSEHAGRNFISVKGFPAAD